jgi:hypothetical protein
MKMGFIAPEDGLRILEMGMLKQYYNTIKIDENSAQRENLMIKKITEEVAAQYEEQWNMGAANGELDKIDPATGEPLQVPPVVQVNDWDNHAVHIEVHNRFRKSQAFQLLPDVVKAEFQKHISIHENALMNQQMMQQEAAAPQEQSAPPQDVQASDQSGLTNDQLG